MKHRHGAIVIMLLGALAALPGEAQKSDGVVAKTRSQPGCTCPKEGRWKVQNLEGWMNCTGPANIKRKLSKVKDKGTIWVLDDQCAGLFGEAHDKKDEDVLVERVAECKYEGKINGEENGIQMVIDVTWIVEGDQLIKGEMHSKPSLQGMFCEYYRPFEISFDEALGKDEYPKLKKKMEKKLAEVRGDD